MSVSPDAIPSSNLPRIDIHSGVLTSRKAIQAVSQETKRETLLVGDGIRLYLESRTPASPKATVIIVHGAGEHIGRYDEFIRILVSDGNMYYGYDQRGHGRSEGARGHIGRFQQYVGDLGTVVELANSSQDTPVFLFGHSMGALVSTIYCGCHQGKIEGLILSGFPNRIRRSPFSLRMARAIARVAPRLQFSNGIRPTDLTKDTSEQMLYESDELIHNTVTAQWVSEFDGACSKALDLASRIRLPCLAIHGGADPLADPKGTGEIGRAHV